MEVKITKTHVEIRLPINPDRPLSASGKTRSIASTRGNVKTDKQVDGKQLIVGVNAYIYAD